MPLNPNLPTFMAGGGGGAPTHRPLSSSFLGLPYTILNIDHKKELLRGFWVDPNGKDFLQERPGSFVAVELGGCSTGLNRRWKKGLGFRVSGLRV